MLMVESQRENNNTQPGLFHQRIGSTMYSVNVHFKTESQETLEGKILRLIKRDLEFGSLRSNRDGNSKIDLRNPEKSVIIGLPQADWLPERGVV